MFLPVLLLLCLGLALGLHAPLPCTDHHRPAHPPTHPSRRAVLQQAGALLATSALYPSVVAAADPPEELQRDLLSLLRVREAAAREAFIVRTGKAPQPRRLELRRSFAMLLDNLDPAGSLVRSSAWAPEDKGEEVSMLAARAVEALEGIRDGATAEMRADKLRPEQREWILGALEAHRQAMDEFLLLMPPNALKAAVVQFAAENAQDEWELAAARLHGLPMDVQVQ